MILLLKNEEVRELLSMGEAIQAMEAAFGEYARGMAVNRPRIRYTCASSAPEFRYCANVHCGAVPGCGIAAVRTDSRLWAEFVDPQTGIKRREPSKPIPPSADLVLLYSLETGQLLAILQNFSLTALRVGATTGLAMKYLAREDADTVGMFGSGNQAKANLEAICKVRPIRKVKVYSPKKEHRTRFAGEMSRRLDIEMVPADSPEATVTGADIICCATNSSGPVFDGTWLEAGQTVVTIVNTDVVSLKTEADEKTFVRSDLIVINDRESVFANKQRELLDPIEKGLFSWDKVVELGNIISRTANGRQQSEELIYYKNNTGMAIQFAAAGEAIYKRAIRDGVGRKLPAEWFGTDLSEWYATGYSPSE